MLFFSQYADILHTEKHKHLKKKMDLFTDSR